MRQPPCSAYVGDVSGFFASGKKGNGLILKIFTIKRCKKRV